MATQTAVPVASGIAPVNIALATVTATAEQNPGFNSLVTLSSDQTLTITFGFPGAVVVPSLIVGLRIPANTMFQFDTGIGSSAFRLFNVSGATAAVSYQVFSRF